MRVPATATGALRIQFLGIPAPEDRDEWHARFNEPPGQQQAHAVDRFTIPVANRLWLAPDVKRFGRAGRQQQRERTLLLRVPLRGARQESNSRRTASSARMSESLCVRRAAVVPSCSMSAGTWNFSGSFEFPSTYAVRT